MLTNLLIKNYALIRQLRIDPSARLNIVTGETGAGKSIMLGALGLLLGRRADTKALYDSGVKCVVEGTFDISAYKLEGFFEEKELEYADETILRREISPAGKSRAFVNDSPVNLDTMRRLGAHLIDIHSQHDTLKLGTDVFQLEIVDLFAENQKLKSEYAEAYRDFRKKRNAYDKLLAQASELKKEADYNKFLFDELDALSLEAGEKELAEQELNLLENAGEIKSKLGMASYALDGAEQSVTDALREVATALSAAAGMAERYNGLYERANSCLIELQDLSGEISGEEEGVEFDPERADQVRERLSAIYGLEQKHQVGSVEELLEIQRELEEKLGRVMNLDEEMAEARQLADLAEDKMRALATDLTDSREAVFEPLANRIVELLKDLGMENATLSLDRTDIEPGPTGADEVNLMFSANKGMPRRPLGEVASGGEFARLMFAVKYILADKTALPTIVFDEIDTGISGEIALKMVQMMEDMALKHQLLVITHLPQIASRGEHHYFVFKDHTQERTVSRMRLLDDNERVEEVAKMIGGARPTDSAYQSARELLRGEA
ncbi:DNA repair protein RecN [Fulvitalea axinellae]|uniref:DNA repair protein RecN n=1 Tax=Fulvitalea axinellae TaxID=1182444 RepID=A0AAU9C6T7_9BACT|nr:DNA repair protein RecN [Fulvitalea axinellae]